MAIIRAMVIIPKTSANTEDTMVNTFHFSVTSSVINDGLDLVQDSLQDFYNAISTKISPVVDHTKMRLKCYDLADPEPRTPVRDELMTPMNTPSGSAPIPEEVCLCLSFRAVPVSGHPPARRRGRVYIGGLGEQVLDTATNSGRPSSATLTQFANAGAGLLADSQAATDWSWVVYSPTAGTTFAVDNGWVDDAWDIQRRRGLAPTVRTTF